jgi:hypothetical protein
MIGSAPRQHPEIAHTRRIDYLGDVPRLRVVEITNGRMAGIEGVFS